MTNNQILIGIATEDFSYGSSVNIELLDMSESYSDNPYATENLENDDLSEIEVGNYHCTNTLILPVPKYLSNEQPCGCGKCSPDYTGYKGQKFVIVSLPSSVSENNMAIIGKI